MLNQYRLFARRGLLSHQAPDSIDDGIKLSEQELEERSSRNVERWVSLHIIPVRGLHVHPRTFDSYSLGSRTLTSRFHRSRTQR